VKNESGRTLTRAALKGAVYVSCLGLSRAEVREILELFFEKIFEALARGKPVKFQSFGSFAVRAKRARPGRNSKAGEEAPITPRNVLRFKGSPVLLARINGKIVEYE